MEVFLVVFLQLRLAHVYVIRCSERNLLLT